MALKRKYTGSVCSVHECIMCWARIQACSVLLWRIITTCPSYGTPSIFDPPGLGAGFLLSALSLVYNAGVRHLFFNSAKCNGVTFYLIFFNIFEQKWRVQEQNHQVQEQQQHLQKKIQTKRASSAVRITCQNYRNMSASCRNSCNRFINNSANN